MNINYLKKILKKYKNIEDIYDIFKIEDEYIINNNKEKIYIYEIIPILLLDKSRGKENIVNNYNRFLRTQNEKFQIYINSKKISLKEYFKEIYKEVDLEKDSIKHKLLNSYINEIERYNVKNDIILKKYYIITITKDIINFENNLDILKQIGCKINKISGKENIVKFLFNSINKVKL